MLTRETLTLEQWRTMKNAAEEIGIAARKIHDTPFDYEFRAQLLSAAHAFRHLRPLLDFDVDAYAAEHRRLTKD